MPPSRAPRRALAASAALLALGALGACSPTAGTGTDGADGVVVLASFYPLAYVAEQVGGPDVDVRTLTPPGADPHSVELSPRQARDVSSADVVVTLGGFQPAVDEVVEARSPEHVVDMAELPEVAARLAGEELEDHEEHDHDHDHGGGDPHVWLDPTLLAATAGAVGDALAAADPDHAAEHAERARELADDLAELDTELAEGLADCARDVVVVPHEAFGHLAHRYGLEQVGVAGLDPEAEPSPARVREVREVVEEHDVTTVFLEGVGGSDVTRTLAQDLGLETAVLDPLETQAAPDADYRDVMLENLAALRAGLGCR